MQARCAVQQDRAGQAVPDLDRDLHAGLGRVERNQPERMVEEMRADIGEKNEAGRHPQIPADGTGGQFGE